MWNVRTDQLRIKFSDKNFLNTKRGLLSLLCSIFEPRGIVSPSYWAKVNHTGTLETQSRLGWGATFKFKRSISRMAITSKIHTRIFINRYYGIDTCTETTELHFFADSSNQAYGVIV